MHAGSCKLKVGMNTDQFSGDQKVAFEEAVKEFRASTSAAVDRPEWFWTAQRRAVLSKIGQQRKATAWKPVLACGAALVVALTVAGVWFDRTRALPAPDFAAGYDQDLLLDVESLTEAQTSLALEPAQLLAGEIAAGTQPDKAR